MPPATRVDVVIVSWNVRDDLLQCLASVSASRDVELRIIVVDNASADGSADAVAEHFPAVTLLRNHENLGFARAVNQGLRRGDAPWVLLLNPDTIVPADAIAGLIRRLEQLPGHALVAPRLIGGDGWPQHSAYPFPSLRLSLLLGFGVHRLLSRRRRAAMLLEGAWMSDVDRDVPWVIGAVMLVRRSAIERAGDLDERFFVYAEDMEWCDRLRSAGYAIRFVPEIEVTHIGNRSGVQQFGDTRTQEYLRNTVSFARRRHGRFWAAGFVAVNGTAVLGHALASRVAHVVRPTPERTRMRAYWHDQARFYVTLPSWIAERRRARIATAPPARSVLVLSNNYPPLAMGGYELICRDHVASMRARGDRVTVVTSMFGLDTKSSRVETGDAGESVVRTLDFRWHDFRLDYPRGASLWRSERRQRRALEAVIRHERPEVAVVWHMAATSKSLLATIHRHGIGTAIVVEEPWPAWDVDNDGWTAFWSRSAVRRHTRALKPVLTSILSRVIAPADLRPALASAVPIYCSEHLRQDVEGSRPEWRHRGVVVLNGIDLAAHHRAREDGEELHRPLRLLYAGRVERRKGMHTAIGSLARIRENGLDAILHVVGWRDEEYSAELRAQASALHVDDAVTWREPVSREAIPDVYRWADVLLFPTIWPEPFGLVPLEAMAAGCLVVATGTGGSGEYLHDDVNALLFPPEDDDAAARLLLRLAAEPALVRRLRHGGRRTAETHRFEDFARGVDKVVDALVRRRPA